MDKGLHGRVAVIAGGGSPGMGRASAMALARDGAAIVVIDQDRDKGTETTARLSAQGQTALFIHADMTDPQAVEGAMAHCVNRLGRLDILFNNTGQPTPPGKLLTDFSPAEWQQALNVNLGSAFLSLRYALPHMIAAGRGGAIINNASASGLRANPTGAPYGVAKAGVIHLTKVAALEYARYGIRVNAICPYSISRRDIPPPDPADEAAGFPHPLPAEKLDLFQRAQLPMMRSGKGYEVAAAVRFLASDAASWITGVALPVDGGSLAGYFGEPRATIPAPRPD